MKTFGTHTILLITYIFSFFTSNVYSQAPWRALIVYTDAVDAAASNINMYEDVFVGIFDEINDIYSASGVDTRAMIAGVIWDKTYVGETWFEGIKDISFGTNGMSEYLDLMDEYSADIIILRDVENPATGIEGVAMYLNGTWTWQGTELPDATDLGYGGFWVDNDVAWIWAHEVGHIHDLRHCDGYRQTFNGGGTYVESNAVSGFHTVMAYANGNSECSGDGDASFTSTNSFLFSDPDLVWEHPTTLVSYNMGTANHNSVDETNANDATIRAFRNTPSNLTISADMDLEQWDYADFLATNSITIQDGFTVNNDATFSVSVGPGVLAKRGISEKNRFILKDENFVKTFGKISNLSTRYISNSKQFYISFEANTNFIPEAILFNSNGALIRRLGKVSSVGPGKYSQSIDLSQFPNGVYFIRLTIGPNSVYKEIFLN